WEHSEDVRPIPFDPDVARRILEQAGWRDTNGDGVRERGGQPLRVEVDYFPTEQRRQDVLVGIQSMVRQIGVELAPRAFERTYWVERVRGREFEGSLWGRGGGPDVVGSNAEVVFASRPIDPAGVNFVGYSNPRADELLVMLQLEGDTA